MDPWLVEELIFAGQAWLYRGKKTHIPPLDLNKIIEGVDALILSQASRITSFPFQSVIYYYLMIYVDRARRP